MIWQDKNIGYGLIVRDDNGSNLMGVPPWSDPNRKALGFFFSNGYGFIFLNSLGLEFYPYLPEHKLTMYLNYKNTPLLILFTQNLGFV